MALPKLLQKLFQNNGAGDKLNPSIIPTKVNGVAADASGNITVNANPPSISVSATTLAAGSAATVTKTGTNNSPVFTFGIPQGAKGDKGATGPQGPAGPAGTASPGIAGLDVGAVAYVCGYKDRGESNRGDVVSGSTIRLVTYIGYQYFASDDRVNFGVGQALSGSWRLLSGVNGNDYLRVALAVRIS